MNEFQTIEDINKNNKPSVNDIDIIIKLAIFLGCVIGVEIYFFNINKEEDKKNKNNNNNNNNNLIELNTNNDKKELDNNNDNLKKEELDKQLDKQNKIFKTQIDHFKKEINKLENINQFYYAFLIDDKKTIKKLLKNKDMFNEDILNIMKIACKDNPTKEEKEKINQFQENQEFQIYKNKLLQHYAKRFNITNKNK